MELQSVTNVLAIVISVVALSVSAYLAARQTRTAAAGYALPVVLQVFDQFRTPEFFTARQFVYHRLNKEFDPPVALVDLPVEAQTAVRLVAGRYDDLGKLVAHGIVDEDLIIGSNGTATRKVWAAVAPFVLLDRAENNATTWCYLEDLARRVERKPPRAVYERLQLDYTREP
ncbi:hypothetical protein AB0M20_22975 [Actinoplanes sp. NPDC051633]|uniref:DUF4760 domain-containing protein n=1 Tax=Actinoplanes sp. NPDC051633 TaxID=3155670 RepID=UPI0034265C1C